MRMLLARIPRIRFPAAHLALGPVARGSVSVFALRITNLALNFVLYTFLARNLGIDGFGNFALAVTVSWLTSYAIRFGLDTILLRYLADEAEDAPVLIRRVLLRMLALAALVSVAVALYLAFQAHLGAAALASWAVFAGLTAGIASAFSFLSAAILRSRMEILRAHFPELLLRPAIMVAGMVLLQATTGLSTPQALAGLATSAVVAAIASMFMVRNELVSALLRTKPHLAKAVPDLMVQGAWLIAAGGLGILLGRAEVLVLSSLDGPAAAGTFAMAFQFSRLVALPGVSLSAAIAPRIATRLARGHLTDLQRELIIAARLDFLASSALAVLAIFASARLLPLVAPEFNGIAAPTAILCVGLLVKAACSPAYDMLVMSGRHSIIARSAIASVAVIAIGMVPLWNAFGLLGMAAASSLALIVHSLLTCIFAARTSGISCDAISPFFRTDRPCM